MRAGRASAYLGAKVAGGFTELAPARSGDNRAALRVEGFNLQPRANRLPAS